VIRIAPNGVVASVNKLTANAPVNNVNTPGIEALRAEVAALRKQVDELKAIVAKNAVGSVAKPSRSEYMKDYMRKKRARDAG